MLQLPLAVGMIDIEVNVRRFDQSLAYIQARLTRMPRVHNIAVNVSRANATAQVNLLMQQMKALRAQAATPIKVSIAGRGSLFGAGGGGGGPGLGMGLMQGLGVSGFAANPAMMAGQMIGGGVAAGVGMIKDGLVESVKTAIDLEGEFVALQRYTGASAANMVDFKRTIFDIARTQAGSSIADLTEIAGVGAKAGVTDKEGIAGLETFTRGMAKVRGAVSGIGTEALANSMVQMLHLFGRNTDYVQSFGSVLARMDNISTSSAESILAMSKNLSGTFVSLRQSIPAVMAFSSVIADTGQTSQTGASAFSQILRKMASDSETMATAAGIPLEKFQELVRTDVIGALELVMQKFKEINATDPVKAQAWLADLGFVGVRTAGAFQQMSTMIEQVKERLAIGNEEERTLASLLSANEAYAKTTSSALGLFKNSVVELADAIGNPLLPAVTGITRALTGMVLEASKLGSQVIPAVNSAGGTILGLVGGAVGGTAGMRIGQAIGGQVGTNIQAGAQGIAALGSGPAEGAPGQPLGTITTAQAKAWAAGVPLPVAGAAPTPPPPPPDADINQVLRNKIMADLAKSHPEATDVQRRGMMFGKVAGMEADAGNFARATELFQRAAEISFATAQAAREEQVKGAFLTKRQKMAEVISGPRAAGEDMDAMIGKLFPEKPSVGVAISSEQMLAKFQEEALNPAQDKLAEETEKLRIATEEANTLAKQRLGNLLGIGAGVLS